MPPLDPAWTRDRIARVADWAWPFVEAHLRTVLPGEPIFRGVDRHQAGDVHRERGHRDVAMVAKVYGRFKRDTEERDRWERIARTRDAERWPKRVATRVATARE